MWFLQRNLTDQEVGEFVDILKCKISYVVLVTLSSVEAVVILADVIEPFYLD